MFKLDLEKGRGTSDQIANICWIIEKAREFQKNIYFCFIDSAKAFDCVDHTKLWKILHTGYETMNWFQIGKGVHQECILSPCLFNLYAEYVM